MIPQINAKTKRTARLIAVLVLLLGAVSVDAQELEQTQIRYLSGTGKDNTVDRNFYCSDGMNSGEWKKIVVPSCWELQGFGHHNFGGDYKSGRHKHNEYGFYKFAFDVPDGWKDKEAIYFTIKEVWSPIHIEDKSIKADFSGIFQVGNRYHYTNLNEYTMMAKWVDFEEPEGTSGLKVMDESNVELPDLAPGAKGVFKVNKVKGWRSTDASTIEEFPFYIPPEKPDRPLSAAVERNYDKYENIRPEQTELYTQFKYTKLEGFEYNGGDGTITRRDPSKVIFDNGKYYVWYTGRKTPVKSVGMARAKQANDTIPSSDWDLSDIWYATSEDGFTWEEQGIAVARPPKPEPGWRSVTTTDILKWKGKYYLYFQAFMEASGLRGDFCPVSVAYADSPDGPWTHTGKIVIPNGPEGSWDQYSIHDPYPLVHDGKIYLYYKGDFDKRPELKPSKIRMQGLAIAEDPLGPFVKHPLNPVINSGHETTLFPFKNGVAAIVQRDGQEHNTIQYAEDWVNFDIAAITELLPVAAGPFVPDAFTDTKDGRGITWGLSHIINAGGDWNNNHTILLRFDCDLSLDVDDQEMKDHHMNYSPEFHYTHKLSGTQKKRIAEQNKRMKQQATHE